MGKLRRITDLDEDQQEAAIAINRLNALTLNSMFSSLLLASVADIREWESQPETKDTLIERAFIRSVLKDYEKSSTETIRYMLERMYGKPKEMQVIEHKTDEQPLSTAQLQKLALKALAYQERELEYNAQLKSNPDLTPEKFLEQKKQLDNREIIIESNKQ